MTGTLQINLDMVNTRKKVNITINSNQIMKK